MALRLQNLTFARGGRRVLGPLSLSLQAGELVGVVGPNGSGKSTLLRLLYGFLTPSSGTIEFEGEPLQSIEPRQLARRLGACPQEAEPSLDFYVEQALALASPCAPRQLFDSLERFGFLRLGELRGRLLSELSGGEKQRVRLARAMLPEPPWLLLDEPANHLDLATGWSLLSYLREPRSGGVVVALHDLAFATRFCHRLLVLQRGQLVALSSPREALSAATLSEVFGLRGEVSLRDGDPHLEIEGVAGKVERDR